MSRMLLPTPPLTGSRMRNPYRPCRRTAPREAHRGGGRLGLPSAVEQRRRRGIFTDAICESFARTTSASLPATGATSPWPAAAASRHAAQGLTCSLCSRIAERVIFADSRLTLFAAAGFAKLQRLSHPFPPRATYVREPCDRRPAEASVLEIQGVRGLVQVDCLQLLDDAPDPLGGRPGVYRLVAATDPAGAGIDGHDSR